MVEIYKSDRLKRRFRPTFLALSRLIFLHQRNRGSRTDNPEFQESYTRFKLEFRGRQNSKTRKGDPLETIHCKP